MVCGIWGREYRERELRTYINKHQPFEVLAGLGKQGAIGAVDAGVPVISLWCLDVDTRRRVLCNTLLRKALEGRKDVCTGFDGVGRAHNIRVRIADVRVRVRIVEGGFIGVDGPRSNVNLGIRINDKPVVQYNDADVHTCSPRLQA